jgi:transposase-like protein
VLRARAVLSPCPGAPCAGWNGHAWLEKNVPEGLTTFDFPAEHRRRIRTNNGLERLNREIKRRTRVASLFPNEASLLRLATAVLIETDKEWQTEKRYFPKSTR